MKNPFAQRFQALVKQLTSGNQSQFAKLTGKSSSHISGICRGRSFPSMRYLQQLRDEFHIDLNWLLTGEENEDQRSRLNPRDNLVFAPVYDVQASAGFGSAVQNEEITDFLAFDKSWLSSNLRVSSRDLAMVTISGDSMMPTLYDGDLVLTDLSEKGFSGEGLYLIQFEDSLMSKRLMKDKEDAFRVISDNKAYEEFTITLDESEQFQIVGKIIWYGRKI